MSGGSGILCFHTYTGGDDGGVRGVRCNRPESQHCKSTPRIDDHGGEECAGVHHMFMRAPINGTFIANMGKTVVEFHVLDGIVKSVEPENHYLWAVNGPWEVARKWLAKRGGMPRRARVYGATS